MYQQKERIEVNEGCKVEKRREDGQTVLVLIKEPTDTTDTLTTDIDTDGSSDSQRMILSVD